MGLMARDFRLERSVEREAKYWRIVEALENDPALSIIRAAKAEGVSRWWFYRIEKEINEQAAKRQEQA